MPGVGCESASLWHSVPSSCTPYVYTTTFLCRFYINRAEEQEPRALSRFLLHGFATWRLKTLPAPVQLPEAWMFPPAERRVCPAPDQLPHPRPLLLLPVTSHFNETAAPDLSPSSASQGPRIRQVSLHNHRSLAPVPQGRGPHAVLPPRPPGALNSDGTGPRMLLPFRYHPAPLTSSGQRDQSKAVSVWQQLL